MGKIITLFLLCLCSQWSFSQSDEKDDKGLDLPNGFRIGFQQSNLVNDGENTGDNLNRGYIGYVRKINIVPLIHLETGMEYMIAGTQQSDDTRLELHYLVLPLQGVVKIGPFVGLAGINGNFRIAETYKVNGETIKREGDDRSNFFDFAVDVGAGFNLAALTFEARYYWGLSEVENGWHNQYWQAGVKLHF